MTEEPLFNSTHAALVFAFSYASNQSPKTPLMSMVTSASSSDAPRNIGQGKGLTGLDSAAQAGFILAEVCRLSDDQHNIIVARYDRSQIMCNGCHRPDRSDEWHAAIDYLSHCVELEGVHRSVRLMMVEKAICGGKLDIDRLCKDYSLGRSVLYQQLSTIKVKFRKLERIAMINLYNAFVDNKLLVA